MEYFVCESCGKTFTKMRVNQAYCNGADCQKQRKDKNRALSKKRMLAKLAVQKDKLS